VNYIRQPASGALDILQQAGIALSEREKGNVEVADFGLNDLERTGLELITYLNTDRCCAKERVPVVE
jgi:D-lyxose ketol-isomerase